MSNYPKKKLELSPIPEGGKLPPQAIDLETAVLGALMLEREAMVLVGGIIKPQIMYLDKHRLILEAIISLNNQGNPVDILTVTNELRKQGNLEMAGGAYYITELTSRVSSAANIEYHARIIQEAYMKRCAIQNAHQVLQMAYDDQSDPFEIVDFQQNKVIEALSDIDNGNTQSFNEIGKKTIEEIARKMTQKGMTGVDTGFKQLNEITGGWQKPDLIILAARPAMGKAQPVYSKVLTPTGFRRIGSLEIGDMIMNSQGEVQFVTGVYPQGLKRVYKVNFNDGTFTECCDEHLWLTRTRLERRYGHDATVKTLREIRETLRVNADQRCNHSVQYIKPIQFEKKELPFHPYVMGVMLGDYSFRNHSITNPEVDIIERVESLLPETMQVNECGGKRDGVYSFVGSSKNISPLKEYLRECGLSSLFSYEKFIPKDYLHSSVEDRIYLLQGLVDTDGYVVKGSSSCIEYSTTSRKLKDDITFLVRSLGGRCTSAKRKGRYFKDGKHVECKEYYRMNISFTNGIVPVSSEKHLKRYAPPKNNLEKFIVDVEESGIEECVCISVSYRDQLYVTDDFILTHNTAEAIKFALASAKSGVPCAFFSLEMSKSQLMTRVFAQETHIAGGNDFARGKIEDYQLQSLINKSEKIINLPAFIDDTAELSIANLRSKAYKLKVQHNIGLIIIDYLQLMTAKGSGNREQEISAIARGLKKIAKELDIPVIALAQLSRSVETRGGDKRPQLSDLRESGAIEQDADIVMFLYRAEYYGITEDAEGNSTAGIGELIIAKHRNGSLDSVFMKFIGKYTDFREKDEYHQPQFSVVEEFKPDHWSTNKAFNNTKTDF